MISSGNFLHKPPTLTLFMHGPDIPVVRFAFMDDKRAPDIIHLGVTQKNQERNTPDVRRYVAGRMPANDTGLNTCIVYGWNDARSMAL